MFTIFSPLSLNTLSKRSLLCRSVPTFRPIVPRNGALSEPWCIPKNENCVFQSVVYNLQYFVASATPSIWSLLLGCLPIMPHWGWRLRPCGKGMANIESLVTNAKDESKVDVSVLVLLVTALWPLPVIVSIFSESYTTPYQLQPPVYMGAVSMSNARLVRFGTILVVPAGFLYVPGGIGTFWWTCVRVHYLHTLRVLSRYPNLLVVRRYDGPVEEWR